MLAILRLPLATYLVAGFAASIAWGIQDGLPVNPEERAESPLATFLPALDPGTPEAAKFLTTFSAGWNLLELERFADAAERFEHALTLARRIGNSAWILESLNYRALTLLHTGSLPEAAKLAEEGVALALKINDIPQYRELSNTLGGIRLRQGDYAAAVDAYEHALRSAEESGDVTARLTLLNNTSIAYMYLGDTEGARELLTLTLDQLGPDAHDVQVAKLLHNIGDTHLMDEEYAQALEYHLEALALRQLDSSEVDMAESHNSLGAIFSGLGRFDEALEHLNLALEVRTRLGLEPEILATKQVLAELYARRSQGAKAVELAEAGVQDARELGLTGRECTALYGLAEAYEADGQLDLALTALREALHLERQIQNLEAKQELADFRTGFETRERERALAELRQENGMQAAAIERELLLRNALIAGAILLSLGALAGWSCYAMKRRSAAALASLNLQLAAAGKDAEARGLQLARAMEEIKRLEGLLPICMYCKSIRDDGGAWQPLEGYLMEHSEAQFSHGICPTCEHEHVS